MPLCNRETLVYDLRKFNVPGTFAQIIEAPNLFKGVNVNDIHTKWFGNFRRFEFVPQQLKLVRVTCIGSFEESRV